MPGDLAFHKPKPTRLRRILRVLLTPVILYCLLVLAIMFYQRRLLYFPTRLSPSAAEQIAAKEGLLPWRNKAGQIIGWHLPASTSPTGAVLIVHGNGGCAVDRSYLAKPIHTAASVDVFVLEYPGYGARDGSPSAKSLLAAADEAFDLLPSDVPKFVVGESLGSGVACHLAKTRAQQVAGLMLFAPYDNLVSVAQKKMPIVPVRLIMWDRFVPAECLKNYRGPMAIVLAGLDEVIPPEFGRRLHDGYAGPKNIQTIPGAGHNEICEQSPEWWKNVFSFWEQNKQTAHSAVNPN